MCRCITWPISCATTPASSDSRVGKQDQAGIHANESAGQCKCVDGLIADHEQGQLLFTILGRGADARAQRLYVLGALRVLEDQVFLAQVAHHQAADLAFVGAAEMMLSALLPRSGRDDDAGWRMVADGGVAGSDPGRPGPAPARAPRKGQATARRRPVGRRLDAVIADGLHRMALRQPGQAPQFRGSLRPGRPAASARRGAA